MTITIYSDASHGHEMPVGSYAYWIDGSGVPIKDSGAFSMPCLNATEAEIKAIANAIDAVLSNEWVGIRRLCIICDSIPAMHLIEKGGKNKSQGAHYAALYVNYQIHGLKLKYPGLSIAFAHVKAHSGRGDPRSLRNAWCDKEAKKELKHALSL